MEKTIIDSEAIRSMNKNERVHLINSLCGFKSVSLIGTQSKEGNSNLAIFSSLFHLGANPALFGLIFRPSPPERDTLRNILDTGFYTLNHIHPGIVYQAHQTSARYAPGVSEFKETGLTEEYKDYFIAPYVTESAVQIGMIFKERIDISINNTILIIGEVAQIYVPENCLLPDGFIDIEKAESITCSGLDSYHTTQRIDRLSYAKPDLPIHSIL